TNEQRAPISLSAGAGVSRGIAKPRARSGRTGLSRLPRRTARAGSGTEKTHRKGTCCSLANPEGAGMSHLIASLAWCWVQLLFVAATAISLSLIALRRSPAVGATIAWSGIIAALVLTALTLVPFPASLSQRTFGALIANRLHQEPLKNIA